MSSQGSFKNGVVSSSFRFEIIDFTGFSETFQDAAVADESIFIMFIFPPEML